MDQKQYKWLKITIVWLILFNALIIQKIFTDFYTLKSLRTNNFITGNVVAHNISTISVLNETFIPLLIYNVVIVFFLTMNFNKEKIKSLFR